MSPASGPQDAELQRQAWREKARSALRTAVPACGEQRAEARRDAGAAGSRASQPTRGHRSTAADRARGDPGAVWGDFHRSWHIRGPQPGFPSRDETGLA